MKYLKLEKRKFLEEQIMMSVFAAALSMGFRYPVYKKDAPQVKRDEFRRDVAKKLRERAKHYRDNGVIAEEKHLSNLAGLQEEISLKWGEILHPHEDRPPYLLNSPGGWITFGRVQKLLNLYLKYCWVLDCDVEPPPHCTIDRNVLTLVNWRGPAWITPKFNQEEYQKAIGLCEMKSAGQNLSEWELCEFNARWERSILSL